MLTQLFSFMSQEADKKLPNAPEPKKGQTVNLAKPSQQQQQQQQQQQTDAKRELPYDRDAVLAFMKRKKADSKKVLPSQCHDVDSIGLYT